MDEKIERMDQDKEKLSAESNAADERTTTELPPHQAMWT